MTVVHTTDHGAVRVVTMNRPEARNALGRELIEALFATLDEADTDPAVRVAVLTGTDPAFCAGVDLKEAQQFGTEYFARFQSHNCIAKPAEMERLLPRALQLAAQVAEVDAPTMAGLKEIYQRGWAGVTDPALAAERQIAGAQQVDPAGLAQRRAEVTARNKSQIL